MYRQGQITYLDGARPVTRSWICRGGGWGLGAWGLVGSWYLDEVPGEWGEERESSLVRWLVF